MLQISVTQMNIKQMDQSAWVCYELPNSSYYYGQIGYLDENGIVLPKDSPDIANKNNVKLIKHGFGIYVYPKKQGIQPKYQGYWDKDNKNGKGKLSTQEGAIYEGNFKNGDFHDHGKIAWINGNSYEGIWKNNRMDGAGVFKHHSGLILKGSFKSNYFIDENVLRNPFMTETEYELYQKQRKEILKQKQRNQRIRHGYAIKINLNEKQDIFKKLQSSNNNNRIPLVISSQKSEFKLVDLKNLLSDKLLKCNIFDLRAASLLKGQAHYNYKLQFRDNFKNTLRNGQALIFNLDESQQEYDELFYPDIKEWYDTEGFTEQMWSRNNLSKPQIKKKVLMNEQISEQYQIVVWSKIKLDVNLTVEKIREKMQMRFQSILPIIKIDIIFIQGKKQQSQQIKEE